LAAYIPIAVPVETSVVAELGDPIFVEPEIVGELVENGDTYLLSELLGIGKSLLERDSIDRDLVREQPALVTPLGERHPVIKAKEVGVLGILVLHDDCNVPQTRGDMRRQVVQGSPHVRFE
jgi:hypothetical protein